jgi:Uma2 family endonuclease
MTAAKHLELVSIDDYLAGELRSEVKHEYLGGYVHANAGASNAHNRVAVNLTGLLHSQLRGKRYEAYNSDTKVRIELPRHTRFCYPDCMVVCESNDPAASFQENPVLLAEVLSTATRRTDLVEKRDAYFTLPSLEYYLLIEPVEPKVIMHRRDGDYFVAEVYEGLDAVLPLPVIECELALADLYERVDFAGAKIEEEQSASDQDV